MWLVAGLGNPGDAYEDTRHNIGFRVIDALSEKFSIPIKSRTTHYVYGRGFIEEQKALLMKPLTFMNRSGIAVREPLFKNDEIESLLIIHDDLDLEPGVLRIRKTGSSGGHNGIQSIIDCLNSKDFPRLKIGIGRPSRMLSEHYVLKPFNKKERPIMEEAVVRAVDAVTDILNKGITYTQNYLHQEQQ
jgi:PTH1 family peptidyl-tRNA hydrolase